MRCRLLNLRDRWSRWRGRQRWCACVAGAGWGIGHRSLFMKCRLFWRLRDGIEPESAPKTVLLIWFIFPCSWSSFCCELREARRVGAWRFSCTTAYSFNFATSAHGEILKLYAGMEGRVVGRVLPPPLRGGESSRPTSTISCLNELN